MGGGLLYYGSAAQFRMRGLPNDVKLPEKRICMVGLIDVGGGMRDVYGTGVLDYCMDHKIRFPYCIGVSAGSANIASYISGQRGRNLRFYTDYNLRHEAMGLDNLHHKGVYLDLDYIYSTVTNEDGEDPWDYDAAVQSGIQMRVVAAEAVSGKAHYFDNSDLHRNDYGLFKCSSALPIACKAYDWHGTLYYDGGIVDPIPYQKAYDEGCDRIVVILTRPVTYRKTAGKRAKAYGLIRRDFPNTYENLITRHTVYNTQLETLLANDVPAGRALIVAPDDCCGVDVLTRDPEKIHALYKKGYLDGSRIRDFLETGGI
jgi:predicted patatin/cPLA2 family phospholipase